MKIFIVNFLLILMTMSVMLHAQQKIIVFFCNPTKVYEDGTYYEQPTMDFLENAGYNVIPFYSNTLATDSEEKLDTLRVLADAIVVGRAGNSGDFGASNKEIWNSIEKPILNLMAWGVRKTGKANWFDTDDCQKVLDNIGEVYNVKIENPDDPVFTGVDVSSGELPWMIGPWDYINTDDPGNGQLLASSPADYNDAVQFVRFEPGVEFYPGAGDIPEGPRTYMGNGDDSMIDPDTGTTLLNYFNFTDEAKQVFLNEIAIMVGNPPSKVKVNQVPTSCLLMQNYPNPFNPTTTISYQIDKPGMVQLDVFDSNGRLVQNLVSEHQNTGSYLVNFSSEMLPTGLYLYKLATEFGLQTHKMLLMK